MEMEMSEREVGELLERIAAMSERMVKGETTLQMEMGLDDEEMEAMYAVAYNYYAQGLYGEARQCFRLLMFFSPHTYKYCLGMACTLQAVGDLEQACMFYLLAGSLDQVEPAPYLHMAECLIRLDDRVGAEENLEKAVALCGDGNGYREIKGRAEAILRNLREAGTV